MIEGAAVACVSRRVPGFRSRCLRHAALVFGLAASIALVQPAAADPFTPLGFIPVGGTYSIAQGVSADGSVVVGYGNSTAAGSGTEAFRWTSGGMVGLGFIPVGGTYSLAFGVNADGSVVVGYGNSTAAGSKYEAFRWFGGTMTGLGFLPGGTSASPMR